jgi:structure-specific endonuclease subunit SLX1
MTSWHCYFLFSTNGQTYIGATVDPDRRLRQHNGELVGGARATTMRVGEGQAWRRACLVSGFPDQRAALQFEWRWKSLSRKKEFRGLQPVERRIQALHELIALDKPTSSALPFAEYPGGCVEVLWE